MAQPTRIRPGIAKTQAYRSGRISSNRPQKKRRGIIGTIFKIISNLVLLFMIFSVAIVVLFRFVPIPFSAYMLESKIRNLVAGDTSKMRYRWIPIERMAPYLPNAVIASEDQQFLDHHGFDFKAISKAVKYNTSKKAKRKGRKKGASTISQQVAKNMFLWSDRSWVRKGFEVWYTLLIEVIWPKRRIMEVYLNTAQMGKNLFGVEAAAQRYYNKPAKKITRPEAALIAASLPNPVRFKVSNPSAYMRKKQTWILGQMGRLKREGVYMELMKKRIL